jgi:hypothetical protein
MKVAENANNYGKTISTRHKFFGTSSMGYGMISLSTVEL